MVSGMKNGTDLDIVLEGVHDERTFIEFLAALSEDWEDEQRNGAIQPSSPNGPGANGWENLQSGLFSKLRAHAVWPIRVERRQTGNTIIPGVAPLKSSIAGRYMSEPRQPQSKLY